MKAVDEKVGKFIGKEDTVFIIPPFQRNYSWDEEQCCELFDDIEDAIKKDKSHYIGNIVYYVGENDRAGFSEYILIDGQQRITSILLLLCAIRSKLSPIDVKRLEKHYLITKRFIFAEEKKMYFTFKAYFDNYAMSKEEILSEMLRLSKYYNWFKNENCPNDKINIIIKELNVLKSDDMYSLMLIIFDRLYGSDLENLKKILDLLCDFMIRYRIVSPTNGSGDIRKSLFTLLSKIVNNEIELNYNNVLYELSNSPSPGGRFPDDVEFKNKLNSFVNVTYAKALLYKLEYKEVKNIEVDIKKVTVEHIMPQTLSDEWKKYLGGEQNASLIYNTYLNNVGNLALLSRPLNSENSNAIWVKKKKNIHDAQFVLTNYVEKYEDWKEDAIKERCSKIIELSLKHITGPLERDRSFASLDVSGEYEAGVYDIANINFDVTGKNVKTLIFNNVPYSIKGWCDLVLCTCKILNDFDDSKLENIIQSNVIHKSTFTKSYYFGKDPIISKEKKFLLKPKYIDGANCFVESNLSADRALYYSKQLMDLYDLKDKFQIETE